MINIIIIIRKTTKKNITMLITMKPEKKLIKKYIKKDMRVIIITTMQMQLPGMKAMVILNTTIQKEPGIITNMINIIIIQRKDMLKMMVIITKLMKKY